MQAIDHTVHPPMTQRSTCPLALVGWCLFRSVARCGRSERYCAGVRGDRVEIVIDAGNEVRTYDVVATRNGRRVEINSGRSIVEVTEVTRGGTPVRSARFMANRVLALVEHPAAARVGPTEVEAP